MIALPDTSTCSLIAALEQLICTIRRVRLVAGTAGLWRWELPVAPVAPLAWLRAQAVAQQLAWRDRDWASERAGIGSADELVLAPGEAPAELLRRVATRLAGAAPGTRYYGGFAFAPGHAETPAWAPFGPGRFVLPQVELLRYGASDCRLAAQLVLTPERDPEAARAALLAALAQVEPEPLDETPAPLAVRRLADWPDRAAWHDAVASVLAGCEAGPLRKVVLARRTDFALAAPTRAADLLGALRESSPHAFHFAFQVAPGHVFLGATPELLYARAGRQVRSEAVAGTRRRGATPEADAELAAQLLASPKERHEHRLVAAAIQQALDPLCAQLATAPAGLLRLGQVQHLRQAFVGELLADVTDAELLPTLAPTPAVAGEPRPAALDLIRRSEPAPRGWYAGPIGWVEPDAACFAVAIRSGLLTGDRLALHAGAGIVPGSHPDREWQELDAKLGAFLAALARTAPAPQPAATPQPVLQA